MSQGLTAASGELGLGVQFQTARSVSTLLY